MTNIPTLSELYNSVLADLESELNVTIPVFGKSFLRALAAVQAAKLKLIYLALGNVQKNIFIDTADPESQGGTLERFGRVKLRRNPFPAVAGEYTVQVTGTTGAVIPVSTTFKSDDSATNPGKLFVLDQAFTLDGINLITLRALEPGIDSKLTISDTLTVTAPIALVNSQVTVTAETVEPQNQEDIEQYRRLGIQAYRLEPQGGAQSDFRLWAAEVQGVRQSYPFATPGQTAEVDLYIESNSGDGTASGALLTAVEESIELPTIDRPSRLPLGVFEVNYLSVTPLDIDIEITGFVGITPEIETLLTDAITSELSDIRPFVAGIDVLANKNDIFDVNRIISVILNARPGSVFGAVQLEVDGNIVSTYTFSNGEIPKFNSLTFV
jgi:uncharacterized phage protein gp47/JayE